LSVRPAEGPTMPITPASIVLAPNATAHTPRHGSKIGRPSFLVYPTSIWFLHFPMSCTRLHEAIRLRSMASSCRLRPSPCSNWPEILVLSVVHWAFSVFFTPGPGPSIIIPTSTALFQPEASLRITDGSLLKSLSSFQFEPSPKSSKRSSETSSKPSCPLCPSPHASGKNVGMSSASRPSKAQTPSSPTWPATSTGSPLPIVESWTFPKVTSLSRIRTLPPIDGTP